MLQPQPLMAGPALPTHNHVLAIGTCPPWKAQSVEVCLHSLEKVMAALAPRVDAGPGQQHLLANEGASARALKLKATELANRLGPDDRLIIYANVPLDIAPGHAPEDASGYALELWASGRPASNDTAIGDGTWMSVSAFAGLIHAIPAGEVILILDTSHPEALDAGLLENHAVNHADRPEALVVSASPGQQANYSADRTISLFAKHLALALSDTDGTLLDVITAAAGGTRQASIPICAELTSQLTPEGDARSDCTQIPEIHDPDTLLGHTMLVPLAETGVN